MAKLTADLGSASSLSQELEAKHAEQVEKLVAQLEAASGSKGDLEAKHAEEVAKWREADPLRRLETYLKSRNALEEHEIELCHAEAEEFAQSVRDTLNADAGLDPLSLFDHVYAEPTRQLEAQRAMVAAELEA